MQERQEFIVDTASQTLNFRSPWGRPSATPSVAIATSGGAELSAAATTYVTLDTVNTTIAASVDAGATSLSVTSAASIAVGTTYWLTNEYGQTEQAKVSKINSTTIEFVDPLMYAYDLVDTGTYGTFQGVEFYYTLQSGDYDELREMNVAKATFTAGGLPRVMRIVFDVVEVPLNAPGALTAEAVYERLGRDLARQEPAAQRGEDFAPQRNAAWNIVRRRLYQHSDDQGQWRPSMIVDPSDLFEYAIAVFTRVCHEQSIQVIRTDPPPALEELLGTEREERTEAFKGLSWLDRDEDETQEEDETQPIPLDFIR
jgi:hypothetical protein